MFKQILKLDSVGPNTIGGPSCQAIGIIYSFLMKEYKQDFFNYILVNHINTLDLEERVVRLGGKQVGVNVIYDFKSDLSKISEKELLNAQIKIIEKGLIMISSELNHLSREKILLIRQRIVFENYFFDIPLIHYKTKVRSISNCYLSIVPSICEFCFFINYDLVEDKRNQHKRFQIYSGQCSLHYVNFLFKDIEINAEEIIIGGDKTDFHFLVNINNGECYIFSEKGFELTGIVWDLMSSKLLVNSRIESNIINSDKENLNGTLTRLSF